MPRSRSLPVVRCVPMLDGRRYCVAVHCRHSLLGETTFAGSIKIVDGPTVGARTSVNGRGRWRSAGEIAEDIETAATVIARRAIELGSTCALDWAAHAGERGGMTQQRWPACSRRRTNASIRSSRARSPRSAPRSWAWSPTRTNGPITRAHGVTSASTARAKGARESGGQRDATS